MQESHPTYDWSRHPFYTKPRSSVDVVDIATVQSLVGRDFWDKRWAIFDRSGDLARTTFLEEEEDLDCGVGNSC
jgi:hypothetical protein